MSGKKVLIVTYYWPPSGGSGVQRWLKFIKYLDKSGWETFVLTPENPSFTISDPSLQKDVPTNTEVMRLPIWEPYNLFFRLSGIFGKKNPGASDMISTGRKSMFQKLSSWMRGNFFIPDPRMFWVKPASTFLHDFVKSNEINTIITTGPPHSIHLVGLKVKKRNPTIKWIADFRDPWSEWDLLDTLSLTSLARKRHRSLEYQVLTTADRVITIAPYHVARLESLGGRKVDLITNGFDTDDFDRVEKKRTTKFTIRHIGVVDELRDPRPVLQAIKKLSEKDASFGQAVTVEFIGNVNATLREFVASDTILKSLVTFRNNIPHDQLLPLYGETDLLLLVLAHTAIAPGNLPGKFFEYLASGARIFAIGPVEGDAAAVLKDSGAGVIFERNDEATMIVELTTQFNAWRNGAIATVADVTGYSRKNLTLKLERIITQ